ncbi:hypothetical protein PaecuDRAFT_2797 [Paenibacillus curdlanolyticus YK9]|uniref:Zinc-ribbon domain-containing protein n=1 Tax=Paenibacillus curdlanolyticus YK9 TaxID=717606 RepID=E0IB70_9BACL|nr:hypothetical protein [Paenibacillus curdlanolyticus]EFM10361.1 hypothetical protein PaecuDRAFT_2797 [Paenibacillus curdlanolyticus YK9]
MIMSINWYSAGATAFVLFLAFALLGAMFLIVKLSTDDSDKFKDLKEMVETIFGTPAHLRSGNANAQEDASKDSAAQSAAALEAFSEPCPACGETVTEQHRDCPSCGLRLL